MLNRLRSVLAPALTTAVTLGLASLPGASPPPAGAGQDWVVDLSHGNAVNVSYTGGALRLTGPTGLLTLPTRHLTGPVGRISPQLDARLPPGTAAAVDVRARLPGGRWSEWLPSAPNRPAALPGPSRDVQLRVVLSAGANPSTPRPDVLGLRVRAETVPNMRVAAPPSEPASYQVIATREGLVDGRTANGHRITSDDLFVALPSRRALADADGSEYTVKVCARSGHCAWAPVWDIGPWNVNDDYWADQRESFTDLPQGLPEAQAAIRDGYNDGQDGSGRTVTNAAGIDLSDGIYRNALGLSGNAQVSVSYLWTGATPLSPVSVPGHQDKHGDGGGTGDSGGTGDNGGTGDKGGDNRKASATFPAVPVPGAQPAVNRTVSSSGGDSADQDGSDGDSSSGDSSGGDNSSGDKLVTVRTAPDPSAAPAGVAAEHAGVPVQCAAPNGWLRIDPDAYLPADAVTVAGQVGPC